MKSKQEAIISGEQIKNMLLGAYRSFEKNYQYINDLNVFPVPDGDTGTNMMHTMEAVARAISPLENATVSEIGTTAARSAIMGARGNSGVILSQLLRGLGKGLAGKKRATSNEVGKAFQFGILYAYRAVSKPVEGTILTVARAIAKGAYHAVRQGEDFEDVLREAIAGGKKELIRTPELLPALKAAGVVDAGGQGLIVFFEGCLAGFRGEDAGALELPPAKPSFVNSIEMEVDLENPYCTEFVVKNAKVREDTVRAALQPLGNSLIVAVVDDLIKVHIHTNAPGLVLQHGLSWGTLHDIKIDNMAEQHEHRVVRGTNAEKRGLAVLAVAAGDGIATIMHQLGAGAIISGGQSMNPSVEAFIKVIENGAAEQYIILPNNKNIILAAEQVKKLLGAAQVDYVPTTNLAQGLAALLHFDASKTMQENSAVMLREAKEAHSAAISIAVRDSVVNGINVKKDQYIGLLEDKIVYAGATLEEVAAETVKLAGSDWELVSLYYGSDLTQAEAEKIAARLQELDGEWEVEVFDGGQPLYPLLLSLE